MNRVRGLTVIFICLSVFAVNAQKQKKTQNPTSVDPSSPSKVYSPKVSRKKKSSETTYDARDKFYDRMEMNSKRRRKNENLQSTPQYSNFQYFGHKKPPKKRPPEKMKYCKICGIRH
jgi:hypothetical protein